MTSMNRDAGPVSAGPARRAKKLLAPSVRYEIFLQLARGETTIHRAAEVGVLLSDTVVDQVWVGWRH